MGKFFQNLLASKQSWYNKRNCKSGRHSQQHTFMHCQSWNKYTPTNDPNLGLKVKGRNRGLAGAIKCFMISIVARILIVKNLLTPVSIFCLTMIPAYIIVTYLKNRATLTVFVLNFLATVSLDTFF